MGFTDVLRKAFPFISVAAGLGGPLGTMAAGVVGKALGLEGKVTSENLQATITDAMATPEQRLLLTQAENSFQSQMSEMGYKDAEMLESVAAADRADARHREISIRDYTPEIGFYGLAIIFLYVIHYLFRYPVPPENKAVLYSMTGCLSTLLVTAATYFYGTTRQSQTKSDTINEIAATAVKK